MQSGIIRVGGDLSSSGVQAPLRAELTTLNVKYSFEHYFRDTLSFTSITKYPSTVITDSRNNF